MIVAGTARSGTTWLANIIASQISCRIMFEPFNPGMIEAFSQFHTFQYMRPTEKNSQLLSYCQRVFSGEIRHRWIDRQVDTVFPRYRLIKDIRANLFLKWIHDSFPEVPLLFIVRHPCAVALSRIQLDWATDTDIESFLSQPKLVDDFLADKTDVIRQVKTVEGKHALIWCISHLVPIKQFRSKGLTVVFYENLCTCPESEIPKIFQAIGHNYDNAVFGLMSKPSMTSSHTSAVVTGEDKIARWKEKLSSKQIDSILSVVRHFGLDYIYGDSSIPIVADL